MAEASKSQAPWLIAAWPGMGNVAVIVAGYLIRQLEMTQVGEMPNSDFFDISEVEVKDSLIVPVQMPRGLFFKWTNPRRSGRDLVVFLGEAQPATGTYRYAQEFVKYVKDLGVERIVTFASMASALHPARDPKVSGVATDAEMLDELHKAEVQTVSAGQIGGLNGLVLATGMEEGIPGIALLAEIPFFAAGVPNPKAARAALSVFTILAGIDLSLEELNQHAEVVDRALIDAYERMQEEQADDDEGETEEGEGEAVVEGTEGEETAEGESETTAEGPQPEQVEAPKKPGDSLDPASRRRIERLFDAAKKDRSSAMALKGELDRLGVFTEYENRFLDLFRRAD
jgi:proteasome assembly chaperone (PAC2) family protein